MSSGGDLDASSVIHLRLLLDTEDDAEDGARLTRQLRRELAELDVELVSLVSDGEVPAGSKAADPITVGAIVVALSASGGVFTSVIETLRDWLNRHAARHRISVTIGGDTIELEKATASQREDLVQAYVRRHSGGASGR